MEKENNTCPVCGSKIMGRSDKKFCDDHCRSSYHHAKNGGVDKLIRSMNKRLKRNRKILMKIEEKGKTQCSTKQLVFMGFDFSIHTSIYINEIGETCYYCYDRGYVSKAKDQYVILKREMEEWEM